MSFITNIYSQTGTIKDRQEAGLHIINELQRFRLLTCCLLCSMGVSMVYTFELFTSEFAKKFGLNAGDQSTISTVGVAFCYFVVPYAVLYEKTGPTPLLLFGTLTGFLGTLGLALIFNGAIEGKLVIICVFYAIMNTCAGMFDASSIVTLQYVFPRNRGPVLGLAKVMTGLGSSVFSSVKSNLFPDDVSGFIFFLMAFAVSVSLLGAITLTLPPYEVNWWRGRGKTEEEKQIMRSLTAVYYSKNPPMRRLAAGYIVGISLVVFFAITAPVTAYIEITQSARYAIGAITLVLVACFGVMILPLKCLGGVDEPSPSAVRAAAGDDALDSLPDTNVYEPDTALTPSQEEKASPQGESMDDITRAKREQKKAVVDDDDAVGTPTTATINPFAEYVEAIVPAYTDPRYPGDFFRQLKHPDIYLIYLGFILQGAIGVIVMYNASTIYIARTGKERSAGMSALYTAFLGVGSSIGRIAIGTFEALVQRQKEGHRRILVTHGLFIPPLIGVVAGVLILLLPGDGLLLPYIMVYFKEGAFYSTCAIIFPALYGTHQAIYYNLSSATTVICVILFNRCLFGFIVDQQHDKLGYKKGEECGQRECILTPIIVAICLCMVSAIMLFIVHIRYLRFVRRTERARREELDEINLEGVDEIDEDDDDDFNDNNNNNNNVHYEEPVASEDGNAFSPREGEEEVKVNK